MKKPLAAGLMLMFCATAAQAAGPEMTVTGGRIVGVEQQGVAAFKGIPFAAPPVGALRWQPPQPVNGWSGVRSARD